MAMPAAKGLFHRAIIQSGPFHKALDPEYSQHVAELTMDQLGLPRCQVKELQKLPVDRVSGAAVEAMKKMPRPHPPCGHSSGSGLGTDRRRPSSSSSSIRPRGARTFSGRSIDYWHKSK